MQLAQHLPRGSELIVGQRSPPRPACRSAPSFITSALIWSRPALSFPGPLGLGEPRYGSRRGRLALGPRGRAATRTAEIARAVATLGPSNIWRPSDREEENHRPAFPETIWCLFVASKSLGLTPPGYGNGARYAGSDEIRWVATNLLGLTPMTPGAHATRLMQCRPLRGARMGFVGLRQIPGAHAARLR